MPFLPQCTYNKLFFCQQTIRSDLLDEKQSSVLQLSRKQIDLENLPDCSEMRHNLPNEILVLHFRDSDSWELGETFPGFPQRNLL
ncbi:hypothetical protein TNIN_358871 [Trichonephila inaurata madagascariensis]|uniref:Uncharacterized protein n=1 Tax=Trichonephila inaurata madagascariensis TaxID=2747483 RepID=A0A8X6XTP8_9ARAC|nr:hypothetical protein TNIN_358871 [Trichonephila inaurata madagascariensis]